MVIDNRNPLPDITDPGAGADVRPGRRPADGEVLSIDDLHVSVHDGAAMAVRGISLSVRPGEIVGLVGESGSGKTLTCRAALGVLPRSCAVERGTVSFADHDVTALSRRDWERVHGSKMGAVFQDPTSYLTPTITVGHQLAEVLRVKLGLRRRAAHQRAIELFEAVGLRQPELVFHQIPAELSGGMLQRVMIATAISCDPQLLVADEPTTALDVTIQAEVIELLLQLREQRGLAVLFVSHDLAVITELCDRIVVFYAGEVVESGPTEEIIERPRHPYTQALLRVASVGDFRRRDLEVIAGQPPQVGAAIDGCRFAARCPIAIPACSAGSVTQVMVGYQHHVRCIRVEDTVSELATR
jgi:peptide/nickel transport system ATP-binding protein